MFRIGRTGHQEPANVAPKRLAGPQRRRARVAQTILRRLDAFLSAAQLGITLTLQPMAWEAQWQLAKADPAAAQDIAGYLMFLDDVLDVFPEDATYISGHGRDLDAAGTAWSTWRNGRMALLFGRRAAEV